MTHDANQRRMHETLELVDKQLVKDILILCDTRGVSQLSIIASVCSVFGNVMGQSLGAIDAKDLGPDGARREVAFFGTVAASLALEIHAAVREGKQSECLYKQ